MVEVLALVAHERQVVLLGVLGVAHLAGALLAFDNAGVVEALLARRAVLACNELPRLLIAPASVNHLLLYNTYKNDHIRSRHLHLRPFRMGFSRHLSQGPPSARDAATAASSSKVLLDPPGSAHVFRHRLWISQSYPRKLKKNILL